MIVDKTYCMSSYLMFRAIADHTKTFAKEIAPSFFRTDTLVREPVRDSADLHEIIRKYMKKWTVDGKAALALSGGIDSAILAKYMPRGSKAYTFQCIVPGVEVTNEVPEASRYAEECGLEHEVIPIYWEDFIRFSPTLMKHKGAPMHSIEIQIYKGALKAKKDGFEKLIFGETSDINYGGMSQLMSQDWTLGEFIDRYSYVMPYTAIKDFRVITEPFLPYVDERGYVDVHEFLRNFTLGTSMGSYMNACQTAGIEMLSPYLLTKLTTPLDLERVRCGENKYVVREIFNALYPEISIPDKLPMPRPMHEWLENWGGPTRPEFWPHCTDNMTGDQKWLVWALEKFLDIIDNPQKD